MAATGIQEKIDLNFPAAKSLLKVKKKGEESVDSKSGDARRLDDVKFCQLPRTCSREEAALHVLPRYVIARRLRF